MMKDHLLDRTVMMWGVKYKPTIIKNGKVIILKESKIMTPIKYLTPEHMSNIKAKLEKCPGEVWNGYESEVWVHALRNEFIYRNKRADVIIKEAIKDKYNFMGKIFNLHREEAFKHM